jgi:hypothetical protein
MTDKKNMRYQYFIYKIYSDFCDKFYIGSTRNIASRKKLHKSRCNNTNDISHNSKIYRTIRENGGWESFRMTCIEVMENTTKLEAEIREEQMRMSLKATLNDRMATRGHMTIQEYGKRYREENKEHIKEYTKEHNKKYKEEHQDQIKERNKRYREENRDKMNEKCHCECGGKFTFCHKSHHLKTIKHQKYLDTLGKSI